MNATGTLITILLGFVVFVLLIPQGGRSFVKDVFRSLVTFNSELGGYVHDTAMSQFVPPTCMYGDTATWAVGAGDTAGTIVYACDATAETANLYVPIPVPSNSVDGKGSYVKSIEIDYLVKTDACNSVTASINKIAMAADGTAPTVTNPAVTQDLTAATDAADVDDHKLTVTVTTPFWIDHQSNYFLKVAFNKKATSIVQVHGVTVNYTARL